MMIDVEELRKVRVEPGDVLVLMAHAYLAGAQDALPSNTGAAADGPGV